jgi:hypothetical protein
LDLLFGFGFFRLELPQDAVGSGNSGGALLLRERPAAHAFVLGRGFHDASRGVAPMVPARLLGATAHGVERFANEPRALGAQPFDFGRTGFRVVEHAGLLGESPVLNLARREDEVPMVVALVPGF